MRILVAGLAGSLLLGSPVVPAREAQATVGRRIVFSLQARRDARLRSGESVRPRIVVECDGRHARWSLDLAPYRTPANPQPGSLAGRLVVIVAAGDSLVERVADTLAWRPDGRPWTWAIPESSAWMQEVDDATGFAILPDSGGPLTDRVDFSIFSSRSWNEAAGPCPGTGQVSDPTSRVGAGLPAFGDYVYAKELPAVISNVRCRSPRAIDEPVSVVVHGLVSAEGRIVDTRVVKSAPGFAEAAVSCVRQYRLRPALGQDDRPVAVWVAFPIRFTAE